MNTIKNKLQLSATVAVLATASLLSLAACADSPGRHPGYLHALTDLRDARWNLEHRPGDAAVSGQEDEAIMEVDAAINEVKKAAVEDGKDLWNHPPEDAHLNRAGRLHHAVELLQKARQDLAQEEDNPEARGLKKRSIEHVEHAIHATEHAIRDVERGR
jgi:hypothetical protein